MRKLLLLLPVIALIFTGCYPHYDPEISSSGGNQEEVLKNGSFELTSDGVIPELWNQSITGDPGFYYFSLDADNYKEGQNGLKVCYLESLARPDSILGAWGGLYQKIYTQNWDVSATHRLQYWFRTEIGNYQIRIFKNGSFNTPVLNQMCGPTNTWIFCDIPFTIDSSTEFIEIWITTKSSQANNGLVRGWIDDMKILK